MIKQSKIQEKQNLGFNVDQMKSKAKNEQKIQSKQQSQDDKKAQDSIDNVIVR